MHIPRSKYFSKILASSYRSSHWQLFFTIDILKNFAILTGKHLCWSLFLIEHFIKKRLQHQFSCQYCEIFKNRFFIQNSLLAASVHMNICLQEHIFVWFLSTIKSRKGISNITVSRNNILNNKQITSKLTFENNVDII